ncbi:alpha-amylase family glycosyl hydrolase [Spirosoma aerophilum]
MNASLLTRKEDRFVLWHVANFKPAPCLVIGQLHPGSPVGFDNEQRFELTNPAGISDLWEILAVDCHLVDDHVYHYWFEVTDSKPGRPNNTRIYITDPLAYSVDWRLVGPALPDKVYTENDRYPASVVKFTQGKLVPCDPGGETGFLTKNTSALTLPPNNRLVIYEMPTAWSRIGLGGLKDSGVGTFKDVTALIDSKVEGGNFADLDVTQGSYLPDLGINALELLPPADSIYNREWGYGTTNFLAPDFDLGNPEGYINPAPNRDLAALVLTCHAHGIRVITDVVMAFSQKNAYLAGNADDFFILDAKQSIMIGDPDAHTSRSSTDLRDGFGSDLFRYAKLITAYDPLDGLTKMLSPARQLMKTNLIRWMNDFQIDGIRMDSIENVTNWDFVQEYKDLARSLWREKFSALELAKADERFIIVGEELSEPLSLLTQNRLDGLWHENFKRYIRHALVGKPAQNESSFEWTVRKAIDCRLFGYSDGAQAIIYLTSHDVQGVENERLFNYLMNNGVIDGERRIKLGFACLLTSVGIPMILAGDEFADQHDRFDQAGNVTNDGGKQNDPVNYSRLADDWRLRIKNYVSRLIKFRIASDALSINDTEFIHVDFNDNKRVLVWLRGQRGTNNMVIVIANFSDFFTANPMDPNSEYQIYNWPSTPPGKHWVEITQNRIVPEDWIGREPIFPWEAKVYTII